MDETGKELISEKLIYRVKGSEKKYVGKLQSSGETSELNSETEEAVKFELLWANTKKKDKGE